MKKALIYFATWIALSIIYFFSAESITKWLLPGADHVGAWLIVVAVGIDLLFLAVLILYLFNVRRSRK